VTEHSEPLPPMYHLQCGEEFCPVMYCRACGWPAGIWDVRGTFGPSGGFERSVPRATTRRRSAGGSPGPGLVPQTIELIGNRWSASILAAAFLGARQFTDMLVMTGAPPTIVSDRLRTFCQMGVLETAVAKTGSGRVEYRLTDKGRAFFPHVMVMLDWGDRWFRALEGPATLLTHTPPAAASSTPSCTAAPAAASCTAPRSRSAAARPNPAPDCPRPHAPV
jgi:DNA-binding HxlR family transcriptional regulator